MSLFDGNISIVVAANVAAAMGCVATFRLDCLRRSRPWCSFFRERFATVQSSWYRFTLVPLISISLFFSLCGISWHSRNHRSSFRLLQNDVKWSKILNVKYRKRYASGPFFRHLKNSSLQSVYITFYLHVYCTILYQIFKYHLKYELINIFFYNLKIGLLFEHILRFVYFNEYYM